MSKGIVNKLKGKTEMEKKGMRRGQGMGETEREEERTRARER